MKRLASPIEDQHSEVYFSSVGTVLSRKPQWERVESEEEILVAHGPKNKRVLSHIECAQELIGSLCENLTNPVWITVNGDLLPSEAASA